MQNISLRSPGMRRKQIFGVLKWRSNLNFSFSLPLLSSFFAFLPLIFFSVEEGLWTGYCYMVFCLFLRCPWLNSAHSGVVWKISSLCTSLRTKLSLITTTDDVTSGRKDADPHGRLRAAIFALGQFSNGFSWYGKLVTSPMTVKQNLKFSSLVTCLCLNSALNLVKPSNGFTSEQSTA